MEVREVSRENEWKKDASMLQSWAWGEFQKELGNTVVRFAVSDGFVQSYIVAAKTVRFLYCPRGPVAKTEEVFRALVARLKQYAVDKHLDYVLIEPDVDVASFINSVTQKEGLVKHPWPIQPLHSLLLSLSPDKETLFSSLRKTTRALVRVATKEGVRVGSNTTLARWEAFAHLQRETVSRQQFMSHPLSYLKEQFVFFAKRGQATLYLAEKDGRALSCAIVVFSNKTAIYLHAASSSEGRSLGASHLLVWQAIIDAKEKGFSVFDFWGIAPPSDPQHQYAGITTFKTGFGGERIIYPGSFAFPVNTAKYYLASGISFFRKAPVLKAAHRMLLSARKNG